ncbi:MAG: hypothetical protein CVV42_04455 [Candidatus Riflebacteria bacterium HGW-Riflebacteria-2]|jgi:hypothetical protein|nr:MAG: hypothetical protein CVV42_04455 [Candidatus Riflebacteria bacterium HGW-Riflebacteria-2]
MKAILWKAYAGVLVVLLMAVAGYAEDVVQLHPFYEQNGDCYLLVGDDVDVPANPGAPPIIDPPPDYDARAVWALNNLGSGIAERLYDPLDAYGLTASQKWNFATEVAEKDLFTFSGIEGPPTALTGTLVPRRIVMTATTSVYAFDEVPPATVHRFHGQPNASPTGRGNHPTWTINSLFGGIDYPCNTIPAAVDGRPGYYWYPVGRGYYHAADVVAWSNWTYGSGHRRPLSNPPPVNERYNQQTDGYPPTQGPWASCCAGRRPENGWIRGGWVRRMIRENLWGTYRNLKLYKYRVGSSAIAPTRVRDVANVLARVTGTMDMNGECCDGCIARVDGAAMPGVPSPYLSCVYSSIVDRTYLYRRDQGSSDFTLDGVTLDDRQIGVGSDTTCQFIGISSRNETGNYVYLLGLNEINNWLRAANAPAGMLLNELSDVAVSDQWWQTGGIVYAYDETKGTVYRFVRNEAGDNGIPTEIDVRTAGVLPDKIGADGFGSLYLMQTEFEPASTTFFTAYTADRHYIAEVLPGGIERYRAEFYQNVYKSVYVRDYYTGAITRLPGRVLLGTNYYFRDFFATDITDKTTWQWVTELGQTGMAVDVGVLTELGVINSPTPPRPGNLDAQTDNWGPLVLGASGFSEAVEEADGTLPDTNDYWFMVENAPSPDANEVNIGNVGDNPNGGPVGQFPTTIQFSSVKYYWKIMQTHNRFGEVEAATILDMETEGSSGDYLLLFPPTAGTFKVGVKVAYRYYDYTRLPVGALSNRKGDVLYPPLDQPPLVAKGDSAADSYAWSEPFTISIIDPPDNPADRGVIMSGIWSGSSLGDGMLVNYRPGPQVLGYGCPNGGFDNNTCGHAQCNPATTTIPISTFVLDGKSLVPQPPQYDATTETWQKVYSAEAASWSLHLRESNYNLDHGVDRIASMTAEIPPEPDDPDLIDGTLVWAGGPAVTWTSELMRGGETVVNKQLVLSSPVLNLTQLRTLFPVPSEPSSYTLNVEFTRTYRYEVWQEIPRYIDGEHVGSLRVRIPRAVHMKITGAAEILVTDNTPPATHLNDPDSEEGAVLEAFFVRTPILYGTTGEALWETEAPKVANPSTLIFVVADNNPMANLNYSNSGHDSFHAAVTSVKNRTTINFKAGNQIATFSYQTQFGLMPPPIVAEESVTDEMTRLRKHYTSGFGDDSKVAAAYVSDEAQFNTLTGTEGKYCKSFSYRVYTIDLANIEHFSKNLVENSGAWDYTGAWNAKMHPDHANNSLDYRSHLYGLGWSEACNASPTNILAVDPQQIGQIIVRDNDRPNAFIVARHDKKPAQLYRAPSNVKDNTMPAKWVQYSINGMPGSINNGPESWEDDDLSSAFDSSFRTDDTLPVTNILLPDGDDLEVDVPVRFDLLVVDNAGDVATVSYKLFDGSDTLLADSTDSSSLQYVFRQPGEYKILAEIEDNAVSWPDNPQAYLPGATTDPAVTSEKNNRKVQAVFKVVPTKLDYRVIERRRPAQ